MQKGQYLSKGILEDIKMLMNYGYDSLNCFTLILCGEPHLNSTLRKPVHEALRKGPGWYKAEINGRGTYFHVLAAQPLANAKEEKRL